MAGPHHRMSPPSGTTRRTALGLLVGAPLLTACSGVQQSLSQFSSPFGGNQEAGPAGPPQQPQAVGTGQVKIGLILPLSASGNAGLAAQSMRNAAEMALAEFQNPNIQLLIKDDGGSPQGAAQGTQQALSEGAEIILGPLFAGSVPATAQLTRPRGTSVIAFSTDSSVAGRGVYLLSFLPESDINRIVDYSSGIGKRSFAAMVPDNAYGNVVEAAFKQAVGRKNGRVVAFEKYGADRATPARTVAQALGQADALLLADDGDSVVATADALTAAGANLRNIQLLGTGLWDNPRVFASPVLQGGLYAAPDPSGFRSFAGRYRAKYGGEPVRTATLAYDAVALMAALARTQGAQRFAPETLTNPSGFAGIDGLFRFRSDGTNERGLAVMKVASGGGTPVAGSPKSFGA
ncbi:MULTISPECIES: penicillin-binding protein activator [unclassified Bradyrhizobium]|uniref:penicillin-binding protein activator n=1 Tax=unclassified Bradyrhizobium TaxID=2631580 RepID=UPI001BA51752|nr:MULTISPECIES: penicillin-binding protein activator [unclassified Bradyrhizobium]MBR1205405.1 penicillin-binding protein activator [Bradyrhizobium sp. AUGA SZCCT0124]MBR1312484.1 penicillin-binding protein activator [Bradyrhizobium sp. AUGA SZCCT0051]MBR1344497.1 penicillin-binding protein activator [Bradyrhizobium sp. AUGA SZCCT0105]MBR1359166.1 penicillin-binding protein activator [Bradyrhizobium sp. AUGA SZCCT0045]